MVWLGSPKMSSRIAIAPTACAENLSTARSVSALLFSVLRSRVKRSITRFAKYTISATSRIHSSTSIMLCNAARCRISTRPIHLA